MKVVVTGFQPMWGLTRSPSGELANAVCESKKAEGLEIFSMILPQEFHKSFFMMERILEKKPEVVIMLGAMMKNEPPHLENFAVNIEHSLLGDNTKIPVFHRKIAQDGPAAYTTNVDVSGLLKHTSQFMSGKISYHAGTHVCNSLYYKVLHKVSTEGMNTKAIFIHVPFPNSFGVIEGEPSTPSFQQLNGFVSKAIDFLVNDIKYV